MPFYYDLNNALTSSATAGTEVDHLRLLTVASQGNCKIVGCYGTARFGTAGGAQLRIKTFATPSTVGTAQTPAKRHPDNPVAATTAFTAPTVGLTPIVRLTVGVAQTGGMGGWVALDQDHALTLKSGGGANGNGDVFSIANAASVTFDNTVEFFE